MKIIIKLKRYIIYILLFIVICLILNPIERVYVFVFAERYATECFEGLKIQILNDGTVIYKNSLLDEPVVIFEKVLCYREDDDRIIFCKYNYLFNGTFNYKYLVYHKSNSSFSTYYSAGPHLHTDFGFKLKYSDDPYYEDDNYAITIPSKWVLLTPWY